MKKLILLTATLLLALWVTAQQNHKQLPHKKYNILWLTCEDISPNLPMYGDSTAHTPNLDKLASESYIFTNAFTTVGVCAPSRSSIITGMYPTSIGTQNMRTAHDVHGWGKRDYSGKSIARDINQDYVPLYAAVIPPYVKCFSQYLREAGYYCTNNPKTDYQFAAPVTAWDENGYHATWKHAPKGMPFFAVFNDAITHESKIWINKHLPQTVDPKKVPLPSYYPDDSIVRQDVARDYSNIELLDKHIGQKIKELKEAGLYDNTIIFFFSDHGGPLPRGKREHYDSGLKVPFMVHFPGQTKAVYVNDLISFVDLAPTMLSLAGIPIPDYLEGQAFLGPQKAKTPRKYIFGSGDRFDGYPDRVRIVRDKRYLYVRNYHPELPAYKDIKYRKHIDMMNDMLEKDARGELNKIQSEWFRMHKTKEEFYDCQTDPENVHNLIDDPKYKDKIQEMRDAMDNWIAKVGDMGAIPEKEMFLNMWPNGVQPLTALPEVKKEGNKVTVSCATKGASIGYILTDHPIKPTLDSGWKVYIGPLKVHKGQILYLMSQRIGYKESRVVEKHF